MTGPEHYDEAERLIASAKTPSGKEVVAGKTDVLAAAQVHATLALAAGSEIAAAALDRLADKIWQELGVGNEDDESYVSGVDDAIVMLRAEAKRLRGEQS